MECYFIKFLHDISALIASMREDKLQTDGFAEAFANDVEK
jgi:hypothetical protein